MIKALTFGVMKVQTITLNNGVRVPLVGFGVYQVEQKDCERCVREALEVGYRLIDTAQAYYNEAQVGDAIKASGIDRQKLFLTTKVWISNAGEDKATKSIEESLRKLKTDYIDLVLIHQPFGDYYGTYRALQKMLQSGKIRAIGLSNFYDARFVDLAENMDIKPAVLQLETHVYCQQQKMRELIEPYGTELMAWAPLVEGKNNFFNDPTLIQIAASHGKSVAQVALKYLTDENIIVIPKSTHRQRMQENITISDFSLTQEERSQIRALSGPKPLMADFNDPELAKFLLNYEKMFAPKS